MNILKTIEYDLETIQCPECKAVQTAKVLHTWPWATRIHDCQCGYTIMESEWNLVLPPIPTESQSDKNKDNPSESA